jgi:hypothetical protein
VAPWTQRITLEWGPELRFYERRIEVLRALEDRGELHAFYVSDTEVRARLHGEDCELVLRRDLLDIALQSPTADAAKGWEAAGIALSAIEPSRPRGFRAYFQHIAPLNVDFVTAVARGRERLFRLPPMEGDVEFTDWAFLADLSAAEEVQGQVEFGIVQRSEIPARLRREVGRAARGGGGPGVTANLDIAKFADVSLFADSWLRKTYEGPGQFVQSALEFWETSRRRADRVVEGLHLALTDGEEKKIRKVLPHE